MYAVGLDVDTASVSFVSVSSLIIIRLLAGILITNIDPPAFSVVGKILYLITNKSAGNLPELSAYKNDSFEETFDFDKTLIPSEYLISDHLIKHIKPLNDTEFGYYLAGLIEGDGYIGDKRIEIAFHMDDISSAFYIKKRIGYGSVLFLKGKNSVRYVLRKNDGLLKLYNLINGKLLGRAKIDQLINNKYDIWGPVLPSASFNILTNHWLAGFADADGSFGIFISKSKTHQTGYNVTINFRIKQKDPNLLYIIKEQLGGNVYEFCDGMFSYRSTSFKISHNVITYFDHFHLLSKWVNYIKWRNAYRIIQRKEHLTVGGLAKIRKLKENLRD